MKNKIIGNIIIIIGIIILLLAIFFFFYNAYEDYNAGIKSNEMLIDIKKYIKEEKKEEDNVNDTTSSKTSRYIKGYSYIGYITIPKINIELPIMDDWSYKKLKLSPCRHFGSISEDNLVIVAHAYRNHFKYPWRPTELTDFWDKVIVDQKAKEIIENFVQNKHEVFLVTASFPNDSLGYKIRKTLSFFNENLINNNNIIICYNKFLIKGDVRIDDGIHNLSNDCINILIDQPWNQNVNENIDYYRIKTWDELRYF